MGFTDSFDSLVGGAGSILDLGLAPLGAIGGLLGGGTPTGGTTGTTQAATGGLGGIAGGGGGTGLEGAGGPIAPFIQRLLGIGAGSAGGGSGSQLLSGLGGGLLGGLLGQLFGGIFGNEGEAPQGRAKMVTMVYKVYENGVLELVSEEAGTPYIMSRDMQKTRRVIRAIRKANAALPKKTVKQSKQSQLVEAATDAAIRNANDGDGCHTHCK